MANTTRIEQAVEAFNRGDEAYFDLYTDDVRIHGLPGTGGTVDRQGMTDFYRAFWSAFPDAKVEPVEMIAGDDLLAVRLYVKGTHRGEIMGVAPSGKEIDVEQITIFKLDAVRGALGAVGRVELPATDRRDARSRSHPCVVSPRQSSITTHAPRGAVPLHTGACNRSGAGH